MFHTSPHGPMIKIFCIDIRKTKERRSFKIIFCCESFQMLLISVKKHGAVNEFSFSLLVTKNISRC